MLNKQFLDKDKLDKHLVVETEPEALPENTVVKGTVRVTVLESRLFRIERETGGHFCDQATQSVWFRRLPAATFTVKDNGTELSIDTGDAKLVLKGMFGGEKDAGQFTDAKEAKHTKEVIVGGENDTGESKPLDTGKAIWMDSYVVLQGRAVPLCNTGNLKGTYRTLDCCDGEWWIPDGNRDNAERIVLGDGVVSRDGVALLNDSASLVLKDDGTLEARKFPEEDIYVFAYGHDYRGAVRALFEICGRTPLIPRFALGNWWSRYHAYTEKEYLHVMDNFLNREIPLTVATVDMDWHWSKTLDQEKHITEQGKNDDFHGGNDGWTGYSWNTKLFPDYRRFLKKLHEKNLHVTLNLHPALGVRYFEDAYPEMAEAMGIDPKEERQIPFDIADARFINAYFRILHKPFEQDGVDFWWIDWQQGSSSRLAGLDPLWALNHYHYLDNGLEREPLILSRYCGIGSHRYPLGFSGDTFVTWESLAYLPYFTATASNAGYTWWSHDIGGHMHGQKDDELYVRFVQFGVFSPVNRLHSTDSATFTKEPWAYGGGSGLVAAEYLRLRHRMIPFLHSASYCTTAEGTALVEPLYYGWPEAEEAYRYQNEYLFGGQLLVAPVTEKSREQGMAFVNAWLPEGRWTDLSTGMEYEGGEEIALARWLEEMPVFLKEGGIFVLDGRKYTNDVENPDQLTVVAANGNGKYVLYEQDGSGKWFVTTFLSTAEEGVQRIRFVGRPLEDWDSREETSNPSGGVRRFRFRFCNISSGSVSVFADDKPYPAEVDDNGRVSVVIDQIVPGVTYNMVVRYKDCQEEKRVAAIRDILTKLQMDNDTKVTLFRTLRGLSGEEYGRAVRKAGLSDMAEIRLLEVMKMPGVLSGQKPHEPSADSNGCE